MTLYEFSLRNFDDEQYQTGILAKRDKFLQMYHVLT